MKIMVLNDGETYTSIKGCKIVELPDEFEPNDIEESLANIKNNCIDEYVKIEATLGEHGEWLNG